MSWDTRDAASARAEASDANEQAIWAMIEQAEAMVARKEESLRPPELAPHTSLLDDPDHPYSDMMKPSRYKIYYGGRDSAKSWTMAEALIKRVLWTPGHRILCCREYQNSIADSVHKLLKDTIYRLGVAGCFNITRDAIRCTFNGNEFMFKGLHNNVHEIKSTEGVTICWVEEAHLTSAESWEVLLPTIRKEGSEVWATFNVTSMQAPTYKRFVAQRMPDSIVHHVNFDQNPFLSATSKEEIAYLKETDYEAYLHVYEGHPKKIDDAVIFVNKFRTEIFPDDLWMKADRLLFGADFGFARDPSTLIRMFIYNSNLYIEYEAYGIGVEFHGNMVNGKGELEQFYDSVPDSNRWPIKGDCSRPETISFIRGLGFNISAAEKWQGSVEDGITHMRGFNQIIIHPRCKNTAQEFALYSYKRDRVTQEILPIIVDKHNHTIDAIRYGLDGYIQRRGAMGIWQKLGKHP